MAAISDGGSVNMDDGTVIIDVHLNEFILCKKKNKVNNYNYVQIYRQNVMRKIYDGETYSAKGVSVDFTMKWLMLR